MSNHGWTNGPTGWVREQVAQAGSGSDLSRRQIISRTQNLYEHGMPQELIRRTTAKGKAEPDDNAISPMVRTIIDDGAHALLGDGQALVNFTENVGDDAREAWENWADEENWRPFLAVTAASCGIAGHAYVLYYPTADGRIRLQRQDPSNVTIIADPDDSSEVAGYVIGWQPQGQAERRKRIIRETVEPGSHGREIPDDPAALFDPYAAWIITDEIKVGEGERATWQLVSLPIIWEQDFCPMEAWANIALDGSLYGRADIDPADITLARIYNRVLSNLVRLHRSNSDPVKWAKGVPFKTRVIQSIKNSFSRNEPQDEQPVSLLSPGDIFLTDQEGAGVWALEAYGDMDGGLKLLEKIEEDIYANTGTPLIKPSRIDGMGNLSGVAISFQYAGQAQKVAKKRMNYESGLKKLVRGTLALMGHEVALRDITISWPQTVPMNELENVQIATAKAALGYSVTTLIRDTGGNPEEEADNLEAEKNDDSGRADALMAELTRGVGADAYPDSEDVDA